MVTDRGREATVNAKTAWPVTESASVRHARTTRATWWAGMLASLAVHILVFILWRGSVPFSPGEQPGLRSPSPTPGGGAMQATNARLPASRTIPPPPEPVVAVDAPEIEITALEVSLPGPDLNPVGPGAPFPGLDGGIGRGDGGDGTGEDDFVSPMPRSVLPYWDPPSSVRGLEVTVRIHVDALGHPTGEVQLDPPTPDRRFNREIEKRVRQMEYRPALRNGNPVPGWAEITFIF